MSEGVRNIVYAYKFYDNGSERVQSAWSKWQWKGDIYTAFALGTSLYTMIDRINNLSPTSWILATGEWNMSGVWSMDGEWIMTPDVLEHQKQFEFIALQPINEGSRFLDNYNTPVEASVELGEWMYGADGRRSMQGTLQFRTVSCRMSDMSNLELIISNVKRGNSRLVPSKYVHGRKPLVMGNAKDMRVIIKNGEGKGFRLEGVSYEGTVTKRTRGL
jgi:hypothetical protein